MLQINKASKQKLRGGYYTPPKIADFLLKWGIDKTISQDIIEPSCGDGVFISQLKNYSGYYSSITGIEYDEEEAKKSSKIKLPNSKIVHSDFHKYCLTTQSRFDLAIGNPPFIRYQYYESNLQYLAKEIFYRAGLKFSKLTNAWVSFIIGCTLLLRQEGKLAFVVPSEILHVSYAKILRKFLVSNFNHICLISFKKLVFDDLQQSVILLLCKKDSSEAHTINHIDVTDENDLSNINFNCIYSNNKNINPNGDKWTYYFLNNKEISLINILSDPKLPRISKFANIEVGITTGANNFFTVPQSTIEHYNLHKFAFPVLGRSIQTKGINFTRSDWHENIQNGAKANILLFNNLGLTKDNHNAQQYIKLGESQGINKGYKTSIRDKWFIIPSTKLSNAFFVRRNHLFPKLILNSTKAFSTDTLHRVFINNNINKKALIACFYNSFSFLLTEIYGRNFGGGVLELMPQEVGRIFAPYSADYEYLFDEIDTLVRKGTSIDKILDFTDKIILEDSLSYDNEMIKLGRAIWHKLSNRRLRK